MFDTDVIVLLQLYKRLSFFDQSMLLTRNIHLAHLGRFPNQMFINRGDQNVQQISLWLPVVEFLAERQELKGRQSNLNFAYTLPWFYNEINFCNIYTTSQLFHVSLCLYCDLSLFCTGLIVCLHMTMCKNVLSAVGSICV